MSVRLKVGSLEELLQISYGGELVVFVGAGVSIARPSSLMGFLTLQNEILWILHQELPVSLRNYYRLPHDEIASGAFYGTIASKVVGVPPEYVMELCRRGLECREEGSEHFALEPILAFGVAVPNANHLALAQLLSSKRVRAIFTTNFDTLIEQAYQMVQEETNKNELTVFRTLDEFSSTDGLPRGLYKLHGCVTVPSTIITSLNDVGRRAVQQKYEVLKTALKQYNVLFIGYRGADLDIFSVIASSPCRNIIWNTRTKKKIIDKVSIALSQRPSVIIEMDLNPLLAALSPQRPEAAEICRTEVSETVSMPSVLAKWAARSDKNSIRLILGDFWEFIGELPTARLFFRAGRLSSARNQDHALKNVFMAREAGLCYKLNKLDHARKLCLECLKVAETLPPASRLYEYVTTLQLLALIEARQNPKRAFDLFIQVQGYQAELEKVDPSLVYRRAILLLNAGNAMYRVGFPDEALSFYQDALKFFDDVGDVLGRARVLNNLGNILRDKGQLRESETLYLDSTYLLKETSDIEELSGVYLNLARMYLLQGLTEKTQEYAHLAIENFKILGDDEGCTRAEGIIRELH